MINTAIALANLVIGSAYPLIGAFTYDQPMTNCSLQESPNMREWYNVADDFITVLPNGDWLINSHTPCTTIHGDIHQQGKMFYRVVGTTN